MLTAVQYSAYRDECLRCAKEAITDEVRETYVMLARIWAGLAADREQDSSIPSAGVKGGEWAHNPPSPSRAAPRRLFLVSRR
jgi:hypothetical protein